jgi:DNA-binding NarL/FixJ family response regulator
MGVGAPGMTRVFLVDARELLRMGISALLSVQSDLEVVGEAGRAADAPARIRATRPDVVVLAEELPDGAGTELCREIRAEPDAPACLLIGSDVDDRTLSEAASAGAAGCLPADVHGGELVEALHSVAAGRPLREGAALGEAARLPHEAAPPDPLEQFGATDRQVVALIGEGLTNRQIGRRLGLTERTIKNHVSYVLAALDMERRTQVAALAAAVKERDRDKDRG